MAQTGGPNAARGLPKRVVNRKPPKRVNRPAGVFGQLGRADAPITHAQRQAHQRTQRAQRPILKRVNVPYVPKLAHPTRSQRSAAVQTVGQGLRKQGVTSSEVKQLARGQGTRTQQQRVNRYLGGVQTQTRKLQAGVGRAAPVQGLAEGITRNLIKALPGAEPPMSFVDPLVRGAEVHQRLVPSAERQYAQTGRQVALGNLAQGSPYKDSHLRGGIGPATIDLTAASNAIGSKLAGNPISAFSKGLSEIAQQHLFSDKGVLGRTANDLLTYPAAAVPTAYELTVHPQKFVTGIADQLSHPVALTKEHPLFAALALHGGVSALGRTGGAIARSGALGSTLKEAAGTSRNMIGLAGESGARIRTPRSYSKDVFRKAAQVAYDKRLKPVRDAKGDVVRDARGRPVMAAPENSRIYSPKRLQQQRATFITSRANARERHARTVASRLVHAAQPTRERRGVKLGTIPSRGPVPHALRGKTIDTAMVGRTVDRSLASQPATKVRVLGKRFYRPEKDVVAMAMEGTLRSPETFHADLIKERQRLEAAYKDPNHELDPLQKRTNRIRARTIDRVLNDKRAMANAQGVFASARELAKHGNDLTHKLVAQRLLDPSAAARAKLFPYAQSHMGAKVVTHQDGSQTLRSEDGTFLSNQQIRAHMASEETGPVVDPQHIAYLPHRNDVRGARAYHQQFRLNRPNLDRESRTGSAYAAGATDTSFNLPLEHIVHATTTLTRAHEFDKLIGDVGIKHPDGRYFTWKEAKDYAKFGGRAPNEATNRRVPGEPQLVPVRAVPAKYDEARAQAIEQAQDPQVPGAADRLVREQTARFDGPDPADVGARNVVLVPKEVADRIQENLKPSTSFDKRFQGLTSAFRTTVLPFSTKWLTGNVVEAVLRSGVAGVSPHDPAIGRKVVREMVKQDPEEAAAVLSHLVNGLMFGEKGLTNYTTGQEVAGNVGGMIAHSLPGRGVGKTIKGVTTPIFAFNKGLEQTALYGALGKYARRQMQEMTGSWFKALRAQDAALKDFAKGLKETANQQHAAEFLDETLGKYSRFSPDMRRVIQGYAPFLPWYLNSVRFVLHTLPVRHPVQTAILTQAEAVFQKDWEAQHPGNAGKGSLKTAIPSRGGFVDASRFTPFGLTGPMAAGEFSSLAGVVLPQTSGLQLGLLGVDPFGQPLKGPKTAGNPKGAPNIPLYALNQLAESYAPGLGLARRFREKGRKSLAGSTVFSPKTSEPGAGQPSVSAPNRIFNPFRPVYISASRAGGGKLSPAQEAVLKAYQRSPAAQSTQGGLTPAQEAVLKAYKRTHK